MCNRTPFVVGIVVGVVVNFFSQKHISASSLDLQMSHAFPGGEGGGSRNFTRIVLCPFPSVHGGGKLAIKFAF